MRTCLPGWLFVQNEGYHKPMQTKWTLSSQLADLSKTAQDLLGYAGQNKVWLFYGDLGAGKTTLIKALCAELGVLGPVTSPTFGLVHEYALPTGEPVYHIDAYRVEAGDLGTNLEVQACLDSGHYCFVEWPEKLMDMAWPPHMTIQLKPQPADSRELKMQLEA